MDTLGETANLKWKFTWLNCLYCKWLLTCQVQPYDRSYWTGSGMDRNVVKEKVDVLELPSILIDSLPLVQKPFDDTFAPLFGLQMKDVERCFGPYLCSPVPVEGRFAQWLHAWWLHFPIALGSMNLEYSEFLSKCLEEKSTCSWCSSKRMRRSVLT